MPGRNCPGFAALLGFKRLRQSELCRAVGIGHPNGVSGVLIWESKCVSIVKDRNESKYEK